MCARVELGVRVRDGLIPFGGTEKKIENYCE